MKRLEANQDSNAAAATCIRRDPYGPLADGESTTFGDKPYTIKRTGQVYYCSCPAWKWQKSAPSLLAKEGPASIINELHAGFVPNHGSRQRCT